MVRIRLTGQKENPPVLGMTHPGVDNFNIQLYRHYPHVYPVVMKLVQEYNNVLKTVGSMEQGAGEVEVEALFGRLCAGAAQYFNNTLSVDIMNKMLAMLSSFGSWDLISDWYIVYDYYAHDQTRTRVSYEDKVQRITTIRKDSLSFTDCSYSREEHDHVDQSWKLRDYLIRVNMKLESKLPAVEEMTAFRSVKVSIRKYFVVRSSNLPEISFRFELIQFWTGVTLAEAERNMISHPPRCTFECEIMNLPSVDILSFADKALLFTSLLLKMQDFVDIPFYTTLLSTHGDMLTRAPVFRLL